MRLIDADALKREWKMGDVCETCDQDTRECANSYCFSRMDVCGMIDDAPTVNGWISVKDRMPDNEEVVLCYAPTNHHMFIGFHRIETLASYTWEHWYILTSMLSTKIMKKKVTHWMPLPKAPEGDEPNGNTL